MAKITKLTPEQEALIPIWREEWRAIGLNTDRIVEADAKQAIRDLYLAAGLTPPELIIAAQSPVQALLMRGILMAASKDQIVGQLGAQIVGQLGDQIVGQIGGQLGGQLGDQLGGQLVDQLGGQIWDQIRGQIWDQLWDQIRGQLVDQLGGQLWDQLRGQIWDQIRDQIVGQLGGQLVDQLRGQLWDQIGGQLGGQLVDQLRGQLWDQLYQTVWMVGGWDGFWLSFYEAGRSVGVVYPEALDGHLNAYAHYTKTCGLAFCYRDIAFVCDRPNAINFDENKLLHCETGPALSWIDGYAIHAWHGTRVPAHWIEDRENVDPAEVLRVENVEQRAAGASIVGWPKMAEKLNRRILDGNPDSDMGALIELTLPGLPEPGRFLMAQCPRNGTICEGVPRTSDIDGLPIETALAAQAWRIGDPQAEYIHPTSRT